MTTKPYWEVIDEIKENPAKFKKWLSHQPKEKADRIKRQIAEYRKHPQPQPKQLEFLDSQASVTVYGGQAGSGKSYALLMRALKHVNIPGYIGMIFRRTRNQIVQSGGLLETAKLFYPKFGGKLFMSPEIEFRFPGGGIIRFTYLESEADATSYDGSQLAVIMYDEVQHMKEEVYEYLFSRNRTPLPIKAQVLATCNPLPNSWLARLIDWWIDEDGFPIIERSGKIRWFVSDLETSEKIWFDDKQEAIDFQRQQEPDATEDELEHLVSSVTFIRATLEDNQALLDADPAYKAKLRGLPMIERRRLLDGCWKLDGTEGTVFKSGWFREGIHRPSAFTECIWAWDTASKARERNDFTAGFFMGYLEGHIYLLNWIEAKWEYPELKSNVRALSRGHTTVIEDAASGIQLCQELSREGMHVIAYKLPPGNLYERSKPVSGWAEAGLIVMDEDFQDRMPVLARLVEFDGDPKLHDDTPSALVIGARYLMERYEVSSSDISELIKARTEYSNPEDVDLSAHVEDWDLEGYLDF